MKDWGGGYKAGRVVIADGLGVAKDLKNWGGLQNLVLD